MLTYIKNTFESFKNDLSEMLPVHIRKNLTPTNIFFKFISGSIFLFMLSIYTYIPFVVYMDQNNIFPYDFFTEEGIFAVNLFSIYFLFIMLFMSIALSGGIVAYISYKMSKLEITPFIKALVGINIFVLVVFFIFSYIFIVDKKFTGSLEYLALLFFVSTAISINIAVSVFATSKTQLMVMMGTFLFFLPALFFIIFSKPTTTLVSGILSTFGLGGEISTTVRYIQSNNVNTKCQEGKLIFLSPKNIYLKLEDESILILERINTEVKTNSQCKKIQ